MDDNPAHETSDDSDSELEDGLDENEPIRGPLDNGGGLTITFRDRYHVVSILEFVAQETMIAVSYTLIWVVMGRVMGGWTGHEGMPLSHSLPGFMVGRWILRTVKWGWSWWEERRAEMEQRRRWE